MMVPGNQVRPKIEICPSRPLVLLEPLTAPMHVLGAFYRAARLHEVSVHR
jgi:hypothetical protein